MLRQLRLEGNDLGIEVSPKAGRFALVEFQRCKELVPRRRRAADPHSALQSPPGFLVNRRSRDSFQLAGAEALEACTDFGLPSLFDLRLLIQAGQEALGKTSSLAAWQGEQGSFKITDR